MSELEIVAFIFNVLGVWLTSKQYRICWLVNIVAVSLYLILFYQVHLYADALLQGIFIVLQVYGWYSWRQQENRINRSISKIPRKIIVWSLLAGCCGGLILGGITSLYTQAALPWLDSLLTAFSIVASIWAAKKYLESWVLWWVLDVIYVAMYLSKALYLTALLYFVFILLAVNGWNMWRKHMQFVTDED